DNLGRVIWQNIRAAGFAGPIHIVNPRYRDIEGAPCLASLGDLAEPVDLAIIVTPPAAVPGVVAEAAAAGIQAAVIITAGLGKGPGSLTEAALAAAAQTGLRLVGPNCLGILSPHVRLNASFTRGAALPGNLALISQSGAVVTAVVEWAGRQSIGFSGIASLGDMADVDADDLLDYFATDPKTRAILLYIESINDAQAFMSAARAAARSKPVVVVKGGRSAAAAKAAASHTGALAGADAVYDAAFRRAGLLRVNYLHELFDAAAILGRMPPFRGDRLAILTNGGGLGILSVDQLSDLGGTLAEPLAETFQAIDAHLPPTWSRANPLDIIGDAGPARYRAALGPLLADSETDAVLVIYCPTALSDPADCAEAVVATLAEHKARSGGKPVLASWTGVTAAADPAFVPAGIPGFDTPEAAVRAFMHLVRHAEAQETLLQTPPSLPEEFVPDIARARRVVRDALAEGQAWLDPVAVSAVLEAYDIPAPVVLAATTPEAAGEAAASLISAHGAVALKINSPDIVHKSDVGGVRLNLDSVAAVVTAGREILETVQRLRPEARHPTLLVQPMVTRKGAHELICGIAEDASFGPVILFGAGGVGVEAVADSALTLPPLHLGLAQDLIRRTRIFRLLRGYRDRPPADLDGIALTLVKLSQLSADIPEIRELDINPLLADAQGVLALDTRIAVAPSVGSSAQAFGRNPRFAIQPYPSELTRLLELQDGQKIRVRAVKPEDEALV
ncbi:acetate--CoA ligase family protein, partial [Falsiroseomonas sp.]|uniref:acetate--CoA ligase family protein n=1 Tax=Falsiroseomonas sp. TaxID=2870721 RepID=UPI00271E7A41